MGYSNRQTRYASAIVHNKRIQSRYVKHIDLSVAVDVGYSGVQLLAGENPAVQCAHVECIDLTVAVDVALHDGLLVDGQADAAGVEQMTPEFSLPGWPARAKIYSPGARVLVSTTRLPSASAFPTYCHVVTSPEAISLTGVQ